MVFGDAKSGERFCGGRGVELGDLRAGGRIVAGVNRPFVLGGWA